MCNLDVRTPVHPDELTHRSIELDRAEEARPIADRLDPEKLAAASPASHWNTRVDALKALI